MGYIPWDPKELDTTEQLALSLCFHFQLSKLPGNSLLVSYCFLSICSKDCSPLWIRVITSLGSFTSRSPEASKYFYWETCKVTTWVFEKMTLFALKAESLMRWMVDGGGGESHQLTSCGSIHYHRVRSSFNPPISELDGQNSSLKEKVMTSSRTIVCGLSWHPDCSNHIGVV